MIRKLLAIHAAITLIGSLALLSQGSEPALSFLVAAGLAASNLFVIAWTWQQIFNKKSFALATGVIVFKYAFLAGIIYFLINRPWLNPIWFAVGLSTLFLTLTVFGLVYKKTELEKIS